MRRGVGDGRIYPSRAIPRLPAGSVTPSLAAVCPHCDLGSFSSGKVCERWRREATLALLEYASRSGSVDAARAARRALEYYVDKYVVHIEANYSPRYVPWMILALREANHQWPDSRWVSAVFVLADRLLAIEDTTTHVGRFYSRDHPEYGSPHAATDGVYTEGIAAAFDLARRTGDATRRERYAVGLRRAVGNLRSLQWTREDHSVPPPMRGAIRTRVGAGSTRMDNTQHAVDATRLLRRVWYDSGRESSCRH